jgi:hypothetical protein
MNFFPSADNFGIGSYNPVLSGLPSLTSILGKSNPNIKQVQEQTLQERLQLLQNRLEQQYGPEQGRQKMQAAIKQVLQSGMFNATGLSLDQASPFATPLSNVAPTSPLSGLPALSPNLTGLPDATTTLPEANQPLVASKPAEAATQLTQLLDGMQDLSKVPALTKLSLGQTNFQVINRNGNVVILDPKSKNAFAVTNESGSLSFKQLFLNGEATPNAQPMDRARFMAWLMAFAFPNEDPNSLLALLPTASAATAATPASAAATPVATPPAAPTAKDNTATSNNGANNSSDKSAKDNTSSNNAASATHATNPPTDKAATETKTADAKPSSNTPPKINSGSNTTAAAATAAPATSAATNPPQASAPTAPPKKPTIIAPAIQKGEVAVKLGKNIAV